MRFEVSRAMNRGERLTLLAIAALALFLRASLDSSTIPGRIFLRHDEQHYVDLVRELLNGRFVTDYFINPPLFGWLIGGVTAAVGAFRALLGFEASFDLFVARETLSPCVTVLMGRALSITASAASVLVVARLGRRLFTPGVGLVAALALAVDGVALGRAPLCGNESLTTLLSLLAVDAFIGAPVTQPSTARRFAAGLLLGLAAATKYSAGIFGLVAVVALGRRVLPALLGAAAGFVLGAPAVLLNTRAFIAGFASQAGFLHEGYRAADVERGELGWFWYAETFAQAHQGSAFAILCALGIAVSVALACRKTGQSHRLLLTASLPLYLFLGSGIFHRERFLLPATPFLLLHGAWLLDRLIARAAELRRRGRSETGRATTDARVTTAALLLTLAITAPSAWARHAGLSALYSAPDAASELFTALQPTFRPDERIYEFSLQNSDELLLHADPWRESRVKAPDDETRAAALAQLAVDGLAPTCEPLRPLVANLKSLAALQSALAKEFATALLIVLPAHALTGEGGLARANRDPPFRDVAWWPEFATWLESLPRRAEATSRDGTLVAAVLELPR
ncbi:MAG: hypothetical protein EXS13_06780 [Planctomycetes bacterium]|nr:hypothetical protein [Planctomycetota bacterium]